MGNQKIKTTENSFWEINKSLLNIGATYTSLLIIDNNNCIVYSKSSDLDWAEEFTSTGLYKHCHLLQAANQQMNLHLQNFSILWDLYKPCTEQAKALDDVRKIKNITHGVGFCIKNNNFNIMLNVAGKYVDINFGANVLNKRKEVYQELRAFILQNSAHLLGKLLLPN